MGEIAVAYFIGFGFILGWKLVRDFLGRL